MLYCSDWFQSTEGKVVSCNLRIQLFFLKGFNTCYLFHNFLLDNLFLAQYNCAWYKSIFSLFLFSISLFHLQQALMTCVFNSERVGKPGRQISLLLFLLLPSRYVPSKDYFPLIYHSIFRSSVTDLISCLIHIRVSNLTRIYRRPQDCWWKTNDSVRYFSDLLYSLDNERRFTVFYYFLINVIPLHAYNLSLFNAFFFNLDI